MNDWDQFLAKAGLEFMAGRNPYGHGFGNPPWSLFFLGPLGNVSPWVAMTFPTIALLFLSVRFRKPYLLLVVGTSFPFIGTSAFGNLDWMVMLGAAIGGPLGVILDTIKPQDGLFAICAELAKRHRWRDRIKLLMPLGLLVIVTIPLLDSWLHGMVALGHNTDGFSNFSLFPYSVPFGLILLFLSWKKREPLFGVAASLCLAPYFYLDSTLPLLFLLANKNWKLGVIANLVIWGIIAMVMARLLPSIRIV